MEATIISKKLMKPSSPTPQNLRNLPISCLDQIFPTVYVPVVLFYAPNNGGVGAVEEASQRKRLLEDSLAGVLSLYYPLAGRYISDEYKIICNDEGVELIEAKVNRQLSAFVDGIPNHELDLLVCYKNLPVTGPLVTIQLTVFECGGIAIGMAYTHRIMDGSSRNEFIRRWSVACSQGIEKVECPTFQLASVLTPARDRLLVVPSPLNMNSGENLVCRRFLFDEEAIRTLKLMANGDQCGPFGGKFSRGQVITALIWTVLIKVCQVKNKGNLRPSQLEQPVNMRDRVKFPIPPNSCGNFVISSLAKFVPENGKNKVDFTEMANLVRNSIRSTVSQCAEFAEGDDIITSAVSISKESVCGNEVDALLVTNWCNFSYYNADFGWGDPIWVSAPVPPRDKFAILLDTKDKSGVEALVRLEENDMILFQEDPDIKALAIIFKERVTQVRSEET